jgi:hypothetical protein
MDLSVLKCMRSNRYHMLLNRLRSTDPEIRKSTQSSLKMFLRLATKPMRLRWAAAVIPYVAYTDHSTIKFIRYALPVFISDFLVDRQYGFVLPLSFHPRSEIRKVALPPLASEFGSSSPAELCSGLLETGVLERLDTFLTDSHAVPDDIKLFLRHILPCLATAISLKGRIQWILNLLRHPDDIIAEIAQNCLSSLFQGPKAKRVSLICAKSLVKYGRSSLVIHHRNTIPSDALLPGSALR